MDKFWRENYKHKPVESTESQSQKPFQAKKQTTKNKTKRKKKGEFSQTTATGHVPGRISTLETNHAKT